MKPSELTPMTAMYMTKLIKEAGVPDGVVNLVTGYGTTVGSALSAHPDVDKVAFTGSTAVGRKVMEEASKSNLKKVTLELGGKGANIIFEDADLEEAVKYAAQGFLWVHAGTRRDPYADTMCSFNHGQTCCAGTRLFVHKGIYDKFAARFKEITSKTKVG